MSLIVIIEDTYNSARLAEKLLIRAGYQVIIAADGETGLTTVFENRPDLVLIDLGLPDIDGQTVVALMRQQDNFADMPIIAYTAWPEDSAYDMAKKYGCDGVIVKPINTSTFAQQVAGYMPKVVN